MFSESKSESKSLGAESESSGTSPSPSPSPQNKDSSPTRVHCRTRTTSLQTTRHVLQVLNTTATTCALNQPASAELLQVGLSAECQAELLQLQEQLVTVIRNST